MLGTNVLELSKNNNNNNNKKTERERAGEKRERMIAAGMFLNEREKENKRRGWIEIGQRVWRRKTRKKKRKRKKRKTYE